MRSLNNSSTGNEISTVIITPTYGFVNRPLSESDRIIQVHGYFLGAKSGKEKPEIKLKEKQDWQGLT